MKSEKPSNNLYSTLFSFLEVFRALIRNKRFDHLLDNIVNTDIMRRINLSLFPLPLKIKTLILVIIYTQIMMIPWRQIQEVLTALLYSGHILTLSCFDLKWCHNDSCRNRLGVSKQCSCLSVIVSDVNYGIQNFDWINV